ncbi:MAG TPA: hypothetical protein VH115_04425 [Solirubrobacteraceae bacterium]|nr:hypothetical protein [Solirubrobacteraceae bacterium]
MPRERAFEDVRRDAGAPRAALPPERAQSARRVALVSAVQDAQRRRRNRVKRLVAIVPVSDYRDVVG